MRRPRHRRDPSNRRPSLPSPKPWRFLHGLAAKPVMLAGLLSGLLAIGLPLGSVWFADEFAARAVADRRDQDALGWIDYAEHLRGASPRGLLLKARLARRMGNREEMASLLNSAERAGAAPAAVRREWMLAEIQSGRLAELEPTVKTWLVNNDPDLPEIADAYANGLAASSRFDEALHVLGAWGQDYPSDPMPAFRAGRIHEFFEDFESAASGYEEAVTRNAAFLPARFALGRVLLRQKKPEEALCQFEACRTGPATLAAEVATAECLSELGRTDAARQQLEAVLEHSEPEIHRSYVLLLARQECFVAARLLGTLETNEGAYEQGLALLDQALRYNPRDVAARYSRAVALRGLGQTAEAEAELADIEDNRAAMQKVNTLRNKINRDPDDVASRIELGVLLAEHESVENGLFWLRSALARDPDNQLAQQQIDELITRSSP